jgi:cation diffusion facilitator family transporter
VLSKENSNKLKMLKYSSIAIASVVIVEVVIGLLVNSLAILSDGLHATIDVASSVMLFFAIKTASKPADEEHTYGHEKFEAIGGLIAGIVLIALAFLIFYEAAIRIISPTPFSPSIEVFGFIAIGYTLSIDIIRLTIFRKAQKIESSSVKAGFYDAVSDFGSTIIALVGFGLATLGFLGSDAYASIFLGVMLTYLSIRLVRSSINELSDSASKELVSKSRKIICDREGVVKTEGLKVRKVSSKVFVEATVQVSKAMSLDSAHDLVSRIEVDLKSNFGIVDSTIHIEPSDKEVELQKLVEKLAVFDGVKEVHDVSVIYSCGKPYITLHAYVDPKLSVEEAHKIAENIENRLQAEIKPLANVTVHIEPYGTVIPVKEIKEEELKKVVDEVAKSVSKDVQVKHLVTYAVEGKRYISLDCCFTKETKITEAHKMSSRIEKEVKEHFSDAVVTVHIEPKC